MTLESMAAAFGVSPAFMDAELAEFIVAGRVSAKIDKAPPPAQQQPRTFDRSCGNLKLFSAPGCSMKLARHWKC